MRGPRLLLVLLLLTAFTLTAIDAQDGEGFDRVRSVADRTLGPAQSALARGGRAVGSLFDDGGDARALRTENERLQGDLARTEGLQRQVDELQRLLRMRNQGNLTMVAAHVVALGAAFGFGATVTLDVGSADGVQVGQTVVSGRGLVGRTTRVGPSTSTVLLLTDRGFTVGARLTRQGTIGLATGDGRRALTYRLVEGGRLSTGDTLLTTGSQTFVAGVPIGTVTALDPNSTNLVRTATVAPFVDVTTLDVVGVVTGATP